MKWFRRSWRGNDKGKAPREADLPACVAAYLEAYNANDIEGMLAELDDEVLFKSYSGGEVSASTHSKAAFSSQAHTSVQAFSKRKQSVVSAFTMGDTVIVTIRFEATVASDMPNGWKAGQELDIRGASEFRLAGDKIISITDQA